MQTDAETPTKHLYVSPTNHARLRVAAAKLQTTIRDVTEKALDSYLTDLEASIAEGEQRGGLGSKK